MPTKKSRTSPESPYADEIPKRMEEGDWQEAVASQGVQLMRRFLSDYPDSARLGEAKAMIEAHEWEWAQALGTLRRLDEFRSSSPEAATPRKPAVSSMRR